jgi:hypothetical protein
VEAVRAIMIVQQSLDYIYAYTVPIIEFKACLKAFCLENAFDGQAGTPTRCDSLPNATLQSKNSFYAAEIPGYYRTRTIPA